jgi:DNA-binding CsgD family transcriptional regulator
VNDPPLPNGGTAPPPPLAGMEFDSTGLSAGLWRALAELSGELIELPAGDIDLAIHRAMEHLCDLVRAREAFVGFGHACRRDRRGQSDGWRVARVLYHGQTPDRLRLRQALEVPILNFVDDPLLRAMVEEGGAHRAHLRREIIDDALWEKNAPALRELFRKLGIVDRLFAVHATTQRAAIFIGFDRGIEDDSFGPLERTLLLYSVHVLDWFWQRAARAHGLIGAAQPLSPRERECLKYLLGCEAEKAIASVLGLTDRTLHQYVVSLYRKLGVRSRAELMARWLGADESVRAR